MFLEQFTNLKRLSGSETPLNHRSLRNPSVVTTEPDGRLQLSLASAKLASTQTECLIIVRNACHIKFSWRNFQDCFVVDTREFVIGVAAA